MTVDRLEIEMSSDEYSDWLTFYDLEPFGDTRNNIHAGMIASVMANQTRKKGTRAYSFKDFMIMNPDERREQATKEFVSFIKSAAVKDG